MNSSRHAGSADEQNYRIASEFDCSTLAALQHRPDNNGQTARQEQIAILWTMFGFIVLIAGSLTVLRYFS